MTARAVSCCPTVVLRYKLHFGHRNDTCSELNAKRMDFFFGLRNPFFPSEGKKENWLIKLIHDAERKRETTDSKKIKNKIKTRRPFFFTEILPFTKYTTYCTFSSLQNSV